MEKYKKELIIIEEWLKQTILSLEKISKVPTDNENAEKKMNELQNILEQLEAKENDAKQIQKDCESYGSQYGDVQNFVKDLLLGLTTNITIIRENQLIIKKYIEGLKEPQQTVIEAEVIEEPKVEIIPQPEQLKEPEVILEKEEPINEVQNVHEETIEEKPLEEPQITSETVKAVETVATMSKPETQAMSTQTTSEKPTTDNFMVIQSMGADGETIQIYNMPSSYDDSKDQEKNVIVEAKYVRDHSGDTKRASELVVKNVPKQFETTFVEPDETTTEIIVDPDGTKRIIVRKLTRVTNQIVKQEVYEEGEGLPEHLRSQLSVSKTTHDVIVPDSMALEQHPGITESSLSAVIEHVSHRIIKKTRKIIKKVTIINGKEEITEEVIEEPDEIEEFSEDRPAIEYEVSQTITELPSDITETITVEPLRIVEESIVTEASKEPETIVEEQKVIEVQPEVETLMEPIDDLQIESKPAENAPADLPPEQPIEEIKIDSRFDTEETSGEKPNEQVFETLTEALVEIVASDVDKLAPLENIQNIWPYETPHITSQSTVIFDAPAITEKDQGSESIWPHNMSIGSNINLNEYTFELSTVEKPVEQILTENVVSINVGINEPSVEILPIEEPKAEAIEIKETSDESTPEKINDEKVEEPIIESILDEVSKEPIEPNQDIQTSTDTSTEAKIENLCEEQPVEDEVVQTEEKPEDKQESIPESHTVEITILRKQEILVLNQEPSNDESTLQEVDSSLPKTEEEPQPEILISVQSSVVEENTEITPESISTEVGNISQEEILPPEEQKPQQNIVEVVEEFLQKESIPQSDELPLQIPEEPQSIPEMSVPQQISEIPEESQIIAPQVVEQTSPKNISESEEVKSPPTSPAKMATITIVKTKTFLEIEKENADRLIPETIEKAIMIVRTPEPPIEKADEDEGVTDTQEFEEKLRIQEEEISPDDRQLEALEPSDIIQESSKSDEAQPETEITSEIISTQEKPLGQIQHESDGIIPAEPLKEESPENQGGVDTFHVVLKVDPSEVSKVNVNLTEQIPPKEIADETNQQDAPQNTQVPEQPKEILEEISEIRSTGYEPEERDDSQDSEGKRKKKKDKKKKQKEKPEDVPSAIPKSTEASLSEGTSIISSDAENVMPEEEKLPEGKEEVLSVDESYRSLSEVDDVPVKVLEENIIASPDESIQSQSGIELVYPSEVIEVAHFEDTEIQTEPIELPSPDKSQVETPPSETKESQTTLPETLETETQVSLTIEEIERAPIPSEPKDTAEVSMQTIIQQFIESESQTVAPVPQDNSIPRDVTEQEIQTDEIPKSDENKKESSMQTITTVTLEGTSQTDSPSTISDEKPIDDGKEIIEHIIEEVILKAVEESDKLPKIPVEDILVEDIKEQEVAPVEEIKEQEIASVEDINEQKLVPDIKETIKEPEIIDEHIKEPEIVSEKIEEIKVEDPQEVILTPDVSRSIETATVETQTKKSKKKKKKDKSIDSTEIDIQAVIQTPNEQIESSRMTMTLAPDVQIQNIDVHVKVPSAPSNLNENAVLQRLNDIMTIEASEPQRETFSLSQNLNSLINNIDQNQTSIVPWNDVQYIIDTNMENRRINNTNEGMLEYQVEEPVDEKINESLQKIEQYINILPEVVNTNENRVTQKTVLIITKVIVTCLEQIEYKIYLLRKNKSRSSEDENQLQRLEALVQNNLRQNIALIQDPELKEDINRCIDTLQQHIDLDKEMQNSANEDVNNYYVEQNNVCDSIKRLQQETIILEDKYRYLIHSDFPNEQKLKEMEALDEACKENKKTAVRLFKLSSFNDHQANDIKGCYDRTKDLEHALRLESRKVIQLINLSEEYVHTLNEFSQITLIANSLVDKTIVTNSLEHLQNEIQRHRKFFVNLNHCRNILESLERNLDTETRNKHSQLHHALHQKATVILEKAGDRAQKLALAASKWTVLEKRMKNEEQWLQVAEQRVPDLNNVTSADYEQYITLYQSLNTDLTIHHSKILQDYETAIKLQELIYAPNLETRCNETLTKLLKIKDDVNMYLKRLLHFKNSWHDYNSNADKLEFWMDQVDGELNKIDIPESFMTYPVENMRRFWEIKAQYEVNTHVHKNVSESFDKSLKIIGLADDKLQLQFYAKLDDRWQNIANRIDEIKNQIIENISSNIPEQSDKLKFLEQELDELLFIINNTKGIIRNPDELNLYIERLIVLKSRIMVVENELMAIGFTSTSDTEKVGELCEKAHRISLYVTEEMELADLCKGRLNTLRQEISAIRENQVDFYKNLKDFEGAAKLESAAISKALEGCQTMREDLANHWQDIMRVRHLLHTLPTGLKMSVSPVDVEKEISLLEDDYVDIEKRLCEIESLLKNRHILWNRFEKELESIQQSIQETDFMVELLTVHGNIDYDRLLKATERLEVSLMEKIKNIKGWIVQNIFLNFWVLFLNF